jgi:hypothetical protein
MRSRILIVLAALVVCRIPGTICPTAEAQTHTASTKTYTIDVPAKSEWVDTKIDLRGGAKLHFTASGQITYPRDQSRSGKLRTSL